MFNFMAADDLASQGARASADFVCLEYFSFSSNWMPHDIMSVKKMILYHCKFAVQSVEWLQYFFIYDTNLR